MTDKSEKPKAQTQTKHVPKDAQVIMCIMKDMGISEYEPRVINQLLEFTYRYVTCTLDDARVYANHAKKKVIDMDDVRLAVQMQLDKSFSTPLPRETLLEIARTKNVTPLPLIKPHCGLRLPPDRYCLSSCNYMLKVTKKPPVKTILGPGQAATSKPTGKPTIPQAVMLKRPSLMTVAKTQPANVPKPVFKFSSGNKVIAKPAIKVTSSASPQQRSVIKKESLADSEGSLKRKREDDDYDVL